MLDYQKFPITDNIAKQYCEVIWLPYGTLKKTLKWFQHCVNTKLFREQPKPSKSHFSTSTYMPDYWKLRTIGFQVDGLLLRSNTCTPAQKHIRLCWAAENIRFKRTFEIKRHRFVLSTCSWKHHAHAAYLHQVKTTSRTCTLLNHISCTQSQSVWKSSVPKVT